MGDKNNFGDQVERRQVCYIRELILRPLGSGSKALLFTVENGRSSISIVCICGAQVSNDVQTQRNGKSVNRPYSLW